MGLLDFFMTLIDLGLGLKQASEMAQNYDWGREQNEALRESLETGHHNRLAEAMGMATTAGSDLTESMLVRQMNQQVRMTKLQKQMGDAYRGRTTEAMEMGQGQFADLMSAQGGALQDVMGGYDERNIRVMGGLDKLAGDLGAGYDERFKNLMGEFEGREGEIRAGHAERLGTGMNLLEGAGTQHRADINRQFDALSGKTSADLVSRGLRGTTIAPRMQMGVERERAAAQGGLEESLRQQKSDVYGQLSGDQLRSFANQQGAWTQLAGGLSGEGLAAAERAGGMQAEYATQLYGQQLQAQQGMQMQNLLSQQQGGQWLTDMYGNLTSDQLGSMGDLGAANINMRGGQNANINNLLAALFANQQSTFTGLTGDWLSTQAGFQYPYATPV